MRGRQFEAALNRLADWWAHKFRVQVEKGIRHRSYDEATALSPQPPTPLKPDPKGKGKAKALPEDDDDEGPGLGGPEGERVRSEKSLMKHALMMRGSPDMSAQLFTSLCRALGLPARLVVSLQPALWRREKSDKDKALDKALQKSRKQLKDKRNLAREAAIVAASARNASASSSNAPNLASGPTPNLRQNGAGANTSSDAGGPDDDMEEITPVTPRPSLSVDSIVAPNVGTAPADPSRPTVRLRRSKPAGNVLGASRK